MYFVSFHEYINQNMEHFPIDKTRKVKVIENTA